MKRRAFLSTFLAMAALTPLVARAQQKAMPVIGFLGTFPSAMSAQIELEQAAFRRGLGETGYVAGQNVTIEYARGEGHLDRLPGLAAALVKRKVDVIVSQGGDGCSLAAKNATSTIPIVFHTSNDPVAIGLAASLARPGGNLTGVSYHGLAGKRIELLCDLVPHVKVIAFLVDPHPQSAVDEIRDAQNAANAKGVQLHVVKVGGPSEIEPAFAVLGQLRADALVVVGSSIFSDRIVDLITLVSRYAIPAIYGGRRYVELGGLLSYGSDFLAVYRLKGIYTGKILKGAKPADLPVERPSRFELAINLKTAKALGLTVPPSILARATEVIE